MSSISALLKKAVEDPREKSDVVQVTIAGELVELLFYRAWPDRWADATAAAPPRLDSFIDQKFGYNPNAVTKAVAPECGRIVAGGEEEEIPADEWKTLFAALAGADLTKVVDVVFALNQWGPLQEVQRLSKARQGESGKKPSSPES